MPTASARAVTQLSPYGGPGRRYGSFAGKTAAVVITVAGLEWTARENRVHYTARENRLHWTAQMEDSA